MISILIPTLNEAGNVDPLLARVLKVLDAEGMDGEVLVVDGGSRDGTQDRVRAWACSHPVRLVQSGGRRGLSGDILHGAAAARGEVMDADLSHPPETIPALVGPLLAGTHDVVIGSRYVRGGVIRGWLWTRALASRVATALAWPLVSVRDPMAGFLAVRREHLLDLGREAAGFKTTMEILARGDDALRVKEDPSSSRTASAAGRSSACARRPRT